MYKINVCIRTYVLFLHHVKLIQTRTFNAWNATLHTCILKEHPLSIPIMLHNYVLKIIQHVSFDCFIRVYDCSITRTSDWELYSNTPHVFHMALSSRQEYREQYCSLIHLKKMVLSHLNYLWIRQYW